MGWYGGFFLIVEVLTLAVAIAVTLVQAYLAPETIFQFRPVGEPTLVTLAGFAAYILAFTGFSQLPSGLLGAVFVRLAPVPPKAFQIHRRLAWAVALGSVAVIVLPLTLGGYHGAGDVGRALLLVGLPWLGAAVLARPGQGSRAD